MRSKAHELNGLRFFVLVSHLCIQSFGCIYFCSTPLLPRKTRKEIRNDNIAFTANKNFFSFVINYIGPPVSYREHQFFVRSDLSPRPPYLVLRPNHKAKIPLPHLTYQSVAFLFQQLYLSMRPAKKNQTFQSIT